jgi:hypothetical protein
VLAACSFSCLLYLLSALAAVCFAYCLFYFLFCLRYATSVVAFITFLNAVIWIASVELRRTRYVDFRRLFCPVSSSTRRDDHGRARLSPCHGLSFRRRLRC